MSRRLLPTLGRLVSFTLAFAGAVASPASGQTAAAQTVGIRIVDAPTNRTDDPRARLYIVDHLGPGATIKRRVEVSNDTDKVQPVNLYPGAASVEGGAFRFGDGRAANDLTSWTTVDPPNLSLAPKAKVQATVTIAVPPRATAGEQYAVVWAELTSAAPQGGGVTAVNRVGVRIYLSVGPGGEPASDFEVTALQGRRAPDGSPVVAASVRNTGGRALDMSGELRLTNGPGGLSAGPFTATLGTTLGLGDTQPVLVTLDKALPAGPWDGKITLRSGTTSREASASITFPEQPASDGPPVDAADPGGAGGGGPGFAVVAAASGVLLALVLFWLSRRRRPTTEEETETSPAPSR